MISLRGSYNGSSPLTRGKPICGAYRDGDDRLIPAHAGKTCSLAALSASVWAHPRSRGENQLRLRRVVVLGGSSPLTRGKRVAPY